MSYLHQQRRKEHHGQNVGWPYPQSSLENSHATYFKIDLISEHDESQEKATEEKEDVH